MIKSQYDLIERLLAEIEFLVLNVDINNTEAMLYKLNETAKLIANIKAVADIQLQP